MTSNVTRWHASPTRDVPATRERETGEIRVPLSLFDLDEPQGEVQLVLSRTEAEHLYATLSRLLADADRQVPRARA